MEIISYTRYMHSKGNCICQGPARNCAQKSEQDLHWLSCFSVVCCFSQAVLVPFPLFYFQKFSGSGYLIQMHFQLR